jgi:prolyl-tRNA synthetase
MIYSSGWKFHEYELKGIPLRIEIGPLDIKKKQVVMARRDTGKKEFVKETELIENIENTINKMQSDLFRKASKFLKSSIIEVNSWSEFKRISKDRKLIKASFCGISSCEEDIKFKTLGITSRLELLNEKKPKNKCINCNKLATQKIIFGKTY